MFVPLTPPNVDSDAKPDASATEAKNTTIEETIELAKRAFALKKYEQAVDHYATALEMTFVTHVSRGSCLIN